MTMSLGQNIARRRKELKLSQEYVANALNVSRQAVSKWETGQSEPTARNLVELARLFDMTVSELVEPDQVSQPAHSEEKRNWRLGLERFAVIAYSASMILSMIEMDDPGFALYCTILVLICAIFMAIHILRLPAEVRLKKAVQELCYCLVVYCVTVFLEPVIRNVFAAIIIAACCVVYVKYIRFK